MIHPSPRRRPQHGHHPNRRDTDKNVKVDAGAVGRYFVAAKLTMFVGANLTVSWSILGSPNDSAITRRLLELERVQQLAAPPPPPPAPAAEERKPTAPPLISTRPPPSGVLEQLPPERRAMALASASSLAQSSDPDPEYSRLMRQLKTEQLPKAAEEEFKPVHYDPIMGRVVRQQAAIAAMRELDRRAAPTNKQPDRQAQNILEQIGARLQQLGKPVADTLEFIRNLGEGVYTYITGQPVDDDLRDEAAAVKTVGTTLMTAGAAGGALAAATGVGAPAALALGGVSLLGWWLTDNVGGRLDLIQYEHEKEKKALEWDEKWMERKRREAEEWTERQAELERKRAEREARSEEEFRRRMQEIEESRQEHLERVAAFYNELEERRRKRDEETRAFYEERERIETANSNAFSLAQQVRDVMDAAKNAMINKQPEVALNLLNQAESAVAALRDYIERNRDTLIRAGTYDTYLSAAQTYQDVIDAQQAVLMHTKPELRPRGREEPTEPTIGRRRPGKATAKPADLPDILGTITGATIRELEENQALGYRARTILAADPSIDIDDDAGQRLMQGFRRMKAKTWAIGQLASQLSSYAKHVSPYVIPSGRSLPADKAAAILRAILVGPPTPLEQLPYDLVMELWATKQYKRIMKRVYVSLLQLGLSTEDIARLKPTEQMALAMLRSLSLYASRDGKITPAEYRLMEVAKSLLRLKESRLQYLTRELEEMAAAQSETMSEEIYPATEMT
jgi:hypothetical protein